MTTVQQRGFGSAVHSTSQLGLVIRRKNNRIELPSLWETVKLGVPHRDVAKEVFRWRLRNLPHLWRGLHKVMLADLLGIPTFYGLLHLDVLRANGLRLQYGVASFRVVTTAGVGYIVDAFQNTVELEDMKYHGIGTGNTAEASSDTDLDTELTTQYSTNSTRATGSLTEGASANIFRSVGTNSVDDTVAIVEHGLFNNATVGQGVLLDRTVFSAINLGSGDSLQSTFEHTQTAGS